jgi:hypothetical protein
MAKCASNWKALQTSPSFAVFSDEHMLLEPPALVRVVHLSGPSTGARRRNENGGEID